MYFDGKREVIGDGQCLLKYNHKGGESESLISPIKLKQLAVPFVILICGYLLAFFQYIRELMHAHFERQMLLEVESIQAVNYEGPASTKADDPDISSHL